MTIHPGAIRTVASIMARGIRPIAPMPFDVWLPKNIVLVDGPKKGELWSPEDAPYLLEIAQCLSQEHPCNLVTVRKAQQTGVSILALAWMLYIAENCPDNAIYGVPGIDALRDINSGKLQPLIDEWQKKTDKSVIMPTTSRSGDGSTTYEKKFPGGVIYLANANLEISQLRRQASALKGMPSKQREGIFDSARRQLEIWQSTAIERLSTQTTFSADKLRQENGTLYLCVTLEDIKKYASVLRVIIGQTVQQLCRTEAEADSRTVTFFLDELPRLGRMDVIEEALEVGRGFGVRLWMFCQNTGQLETAYPNAALSAPI